MAWEDFISEKVVDFQEKAQNLYSCESDFGVEIEELEQQIKDLNYRRIECKSRAQTFQDCANDLNDYLKKTIDQRVA